MHKSTFIIFLISLLIALSFIMSAQRVRPRIPVVYYSYDAKGNIVKRETRQELDPRTLPGGHDTIPFPGGDTMIIIYPNPTPGPLIAEATNYSGDFPLYYQLFTESGVLIQTLSSQEALTEIDMSRLPSGIYVLHAMRGETIVGIQVIKVN